MINGGQKIKGSMLLLCTLEGNVLDTPVTNFKVTIKTEGQH